MKITIEPTFDVGTINGVQCRTWIGTSEGGVPCFVFVSRIAIERQHEEAFDKERVASPLIAAGRAYIAANTINPECTTGRRVAHDDPLPSDTRTLDENCTTGSARAIEPPLPMLVRQALRRDERAAIGYCLGMLACLIHDLPGSPDTIRRTVDLIRISAQGAAIELPDHILERLARAEVANDDGH